MGMFFIVALIGIELFKPIRDYLILVESNANLFKSETFAYFFGDAVRC